MKPLPTFLLRFKSILHGVGVKSKSKYILEVSDRT